MMATYGDGECLDGPGGCQGEVWPRATLSGSGDSYYRCDRHYELYAERLQPIMDDISRRYPVMAPPDFDPLACGESWDDDGW